MATLTDWLVARGWDRDEVLRGVSWVRVGRKLILQPSAPGGARADRRERVARIQVHAADLVGLVLRDGSGAAYTTHLRPSGAVGLIGFGRDLSHDWDVWSAAEISPRLTVGT